MIEVGIGISMPPPKRGCGLNVEPKYPWDTMVPGNSFLAEEGCKAAPSAPAPLVKRGWKFGSRKIDGRFRVWRIK